MSFIFVDVADKVNVNFWVFDAGIVLIALVEIPQTWQHLTICMFIERGCHFSSSTFYLLDPGKSLYI
jgi:hypothetical protein